MARYFVFIDKQPEISSITANICLPSDSNHLMASCSTLAPLYGLNIGQWKRLGRKTAVELASFVKEGKSARQLRLTGLL